MRARGMLSEYAVRMYWELAEAFLILENTYPVAVDMKLLMVKN